MHCCMLPTDNRSSVSRILARILKLPVQNNYSKISAGYDLATQLPQTSLYHLDLIAYCVKKSNSYFSYVLENG